jgi:cyanate permease
MYLVNDLMDLKATVAIPASVIARLRRADYRHWQAIVAMVALIASFGIAFNVTRAFVAWLAVYFAMTLAYTFWLSARR